MIREFGSSTFWMAFFDADEFMFCPSRDDIRTFLAEFEPHAGLAVHNKEFGSSNHVLKPQGLSIEAFVHRAADDFRFHHAVKCFVRPSEVERPLSPHLFVTRSPIVTENHVPCGLEGTWELRTKPLFARIRYNHYHTRSMEDWVERARRGNCNDPKPNYRFDIKHFMERDHRAVVDTEILRFVPKLKRAMNRNWTAE